MASDTVTEPDRTPQDPSSRRTPPATLRRALVSPRSFGLLAVALIVAAIFAWLCQWQLERAWRAAPTQETAPTETVRPLEEVVEPGSLLSDTAVGQRVSVDGSFVAGDYIVISDRVNGDETGYWVTGHFTTTEGAALAVALGWSADRETADAEADRLNAESPAAEELTGRVVSSQAPELDEDDPYELTTMAVAAFVNLWSGMDDTDVYEVYLISASAPSSLVAIDAPAPEQEVEVNWLNIFYAIEWIVFAGFALFLWYRLVRDSWEREVEEREQADAEAATGPGREDAASPEHVN